MKKITIKKQVVESNGFFGVGFILSDEEVKLLYQQGKPVLFDTRQKAQDYIDSE
jgi:hypothetical protein